MITRFCEKMGKVRTKKKRMDRFSNLPDEIICHIASFLSAKEAAFTTVLSKRFQNLFTIIPNLHFSYLDWDHRSLTDFLDGVLALPASSRIRKFSLECSFTDRRHYAHVNRCLCDVLLKHGVLDLELDCYFKKLYSLPFEVFTCKTITKLKLGSGFVIDVLPRNAFLPALETLFLENVRFNDPQGCAFKAFLSACPVLKELIIQGIEWEHWKWSGNLSSPTLQRLTISHGDSFDHFKITRITLDTPSLVYLDFSDVVPDEYPIVNLDSIVQVKLDLVLMVDHYSVEGFVVHDENITSNPTNLIKGLRNVEIMNLSSFTTFQVFYYFREAIPVFENLYHLTITPDNVFSCREGLPFVVKKCPNLETLVIDGPLHYDEKEPESVCGCMLGYSFLLSCPVKFLVIKKYNGTSGEVVQLKHFLEKLSCLEMVNVCCPARGPWDDKETLKLPRVSTKCKIMVTIS